MSSFLSRATSLTSSVTSNVAGVTGRISSVIKDPSKQKVVLIIDDHQTDWSKYFRGRRLHGDFEIKVEQAEFREINLHSNSESGTICSIVNYDRSGNKSSRSFRPDFLLIRQHIKDVYEDYRDLLLGFKYGGIPSINSLNSLYNFTDRPWVFSQLIGIQRRLGKENFPLLEQTFFPNYKEMVNNPPKFPCVIKIGHAHSGQGKMKMDNPGDYQDIVSIVACSKTFCTIEPYVEAKCDIHIQKIGANYKAFMRKSISGNWKANIGSAMLEQCPVTEKHKRWIDEVSELFGGLDIVTIEAVLSKDGNEYIYEITGSQMTLMGETQEEDRRLIADLVCAKMNHFCGRPMMSKQTSRSNISTTGSYSVDSLSNENSRQQQPPGGAPPSTGPGGPPPQQQQQQQRPSLTGSINSSAPGSRRGSQPSMGSSAEIMGSQSQPGSGAPSGPAPNSESTPNPVSQVGQATQQIKGLFRRASQTSDDEKKEDPEDTMRNLRKTFAGIFGDM